MDEVLKQLQQTVKDTASEAIQSVKKSNVGLIERVPGLDFGKISKKGMTP